MGDTSNLTGKDFEFLITHPDDFEISSDLFDKLMTPDTIEWTKVIKNNWTYYKVGQDEFSYSWEPPGIQMTFNEEIEYDKAKKIADQVVTKLKKQSGLNIGLEFIGYDNIIKFD